MTIITLIYWITINHVLLWMIMIDSKGTVHWKWSFVELCICWWKPWNRLVSNILCGVFRDGTAQGGTDISKNCDYVTQNGFLEFSHAETSKIISVDINKNAKVRFLTIKICHFLNEYYSFVSSKLFMFFYPNLIYCKNGYTMEALILQVFCSYKMFYK